jgi:hypothetical protein
MKKIFTLILLVSFGFITRIEAQAPGDITMILQKCIDLPDLQQFFPVNNDGSLKQLYVLQHGVSFPSNTNVLKSGLKVRFVNKNQLAAEEITSYFIFWEFVIDNNSAKVDFIYNFMDADNTTKMYHEKLEMRKLGDKWIVSGTKEERR